MSGTFWHIVTACIVIISQIEAARILAYFPTPSISHQVVFRPLTEALARRGHEVTVITTDPAFPKGGTPPNLTEIDVHDISYGIWWKEVMKEQRGVVENDVVAPMKNMIEAMMKVFDKQLEDENIQTLINSKQKKFDLLLLEALMAPLLAFSHVYKVPVIQVSSFGAVFGNYETVGAPTHPLLYPLGTRRKLNNLSMWEKVTELYDNYKLEQILISDMYYTFGGPILRKHFGPNIPPVTELMNNVDMLFLNIHPMFEGIRPVPPSVIYMSGLHQKPAKEIPKDLKTYLDSSKHGVIYISFGTNVDPTLLPPEKIQTLVRVFSQLPYDVLWKWNKDELPGRTDNIRISKWLPQSDLLKHPKVKLFITQGGLQSTDEAITAGVPLIGMPMLADQWFNVERYETHKIGVRLDMQTLTEENLKNAITTIIEDDSYRRHMERFRSLIQDAPQSPLERAVWWTEYVLRHGGAKHLRSPSANISWTQYLELELVLTLLAATLIARRGHEVTVITTDPAFPKGGTPPNLTEIDVHDISYGLWWEEVMKEQRGVDENDVEAPLRVMMQTMMKILDKQLEDENVQTLINGKQENFDLLLLEAFLTPCLAFSHVFKVPVIQVSSCGAIFGNYETVGAPIHPFLYPLSSRRKLNNLSMWEKVTELYNSYKLDKLIWDIYNVFGNTDLIKHFGPDLPPLSELMNNVDMLFLNIHPMFEGIRPVPPSVIYISGLHQKPTKELPKDLKSYLDSSKHGVIYISFGTNVDPSLLPPEKIQTLVRVFSQLPYDVLWKWNKDELPGRTDNIRISKWLPQSDLLKHPKIKLFITQGGLQSTDEAITAGVPLIGMPMLGDQWFNVERYEFHKIGVKVDMETLTEENLKNAIATIIIGDDSYRRNMERFRSLIQDAPQSPLERAVWWTEYVLRHGGAKHLRSPSANISWTQYLELELVLTVLAATLIAITVIVLALRVVLKFVVIKYLGVSGNKIKRN